MSNIDKSELHNIFKRLKHGKQEAVQELYEKYKKLVYGIAFSIVKNKDDSEDIVQNTFKKIIETEAEKLPNNFEATWIYTVTKNEALQYLNKKDNNINIDDIYNIQDKNDEIANILDCQTYNNMISKLNYKDKEIISLKIISGLSFNQIGMVFGENVSTIKWRYYNAIYKLKLILSNISIATISFIAGLTIYKKENSDIKSIESAENQFNAEIFNNYLLEDEASKSKSKSEMQDTINRDYSIETKNNTNQNIANINEIIQENDEVLKEQSCIGNGVMTFSIVLLLVTIILFIKNHVKYRKKLSNR